MSSWKGKQSRRLVSAICNSVSEQQQVADLRRKRSGNGGPFVPIRFQGSGHPFAVCHCSWRAAKCTGKFEVNSLSTLEQSS